MICKVRHHFILCLGVSSHYKCEAQKKGENMKKDIGKMMCILAAVFLAHGLMAEYDSEDIGIQIKELGKELKVLEKKNPMVYYTDKDHPSINIAKKMRKTFINRTFRCPTHKGFTYDAEGMCMAMRNAWGDYRPCKAQNKYLEWKDLREKIGETERIEGEMVAIKERLDELKKIRSSCRK